MKLEQARVNGGSNYDFLEGADASRMDKGDSQCHKNCVTKPQPRDRAWDYQG